MSSFAVLLLCIQACLVQNVFGSCVSYGAGTGSGLGLRTGLGLNAGLGLGLTPAALGAGALNAKYGIRSPAATIASPGLDYGGAIGSAYGGAGEGNVAVAGELPVAGNTAVAGQVPFIGAVNFGGVVPAAGSVTISGKCACGCDY